DALGGEDTGDVGEEPDRLEQVARHDRHHHVELEVAHGPPEGNGGVVADDLGRHLAHRLGDHRVDLAGHDRAAGLEVGDADLAQACGGPAPHPAQVVGDLE